MIQIDDVQKHAQRKQMQQEANATPAPQPVEVANNPAPVSEPSPVPASAVDPAAPAVTQTGSPQQKQEVPPVIPSLAVAPGGPTSPMDEKPAVTITDPTDTKLVGGNLPDITTETFEEAMKRGKYTPAEWLHENEKAAKEGRRHPLTTMDYLTVFKYGDLNETPEQKAKRERREQISQAISGIGNVIANAANLAFAAKGAVPIDLNSGVRYENERMQRIKEKRDALKEKSDALFLNAKQDEIRYARSLEAAKAKAAAEREEKIQQRAFELLKQDKELSARAAREKAAREFNGKHKDATLAEDTRHHKAMEGIGYANAKTAAERAKQAKEKSSKDEKYAASFSGKYGTYRFHDKDIASAVSSQAISMLKNSAAKNGDAGTVEMVKDAMAELKSAPAVLEFLQQRLYKYPDVEKFIAEQNKKYSGNVIIQNEEAIQSAINARNNSSTYKNKNVPPYKRKQSTISNKAPYIK